MHFDYPENVIRIMRPQMSNLLYIVRHHFKRRSESDLRRSAVKNWVKSFRDADNSSGYSIALRQTGKPGYRSIKKIQGK